MSVSERSLLKDSSSDEILDSLEVTKNLRSKIDCVLAQMPEMDKKLEKLDARVNKLKANQSEVRGKVKEMEVA